MKMGKKNNLELSPFMEYLVNLRKFLDKKCLKLLTKELNAENYVKSVQATLSSTVLLNKIKLGEVASTPPSFFTDGLT